MALFTHGRCKRLHLVLALTAALPVLASARRAAACTPTGCYTETFIPRGGSVPANLQAFFWAPGPQLHKEKTYDNSVLTLTRSDTGAVVPVVLAPIASKDAWSAPYYSSRFLVHPAEPLAAGVRYRIDSAAPDCFSSDVNAAFRVDEAAPLPTSLGQLDAGTHEVGPLTVASTGCSASLEAAQVPISLTFADDALPWSAALFFETYVDGERYTPSPTLGYDIGFPPGGGVPPPGQSWRGRGVDLVYALCESSNLYASPGVGPGEHQVVMQARIPGSDVVLASEPLDIVLECPPEPSASDTGGCSMGKAAPHASWPFLVLAMMGFRRRRARA